MGRELSQSPVRPIVFVKELTLTRRTRKKEEHTSIASCSCRCVGSATVGEEHANTRALVALSGADEGTGKTWRGIPGRTAVVCPQARQCRAHVLGGRGLGGPYQSASFH